MKYVLLFLVLVSSVFAQEANHVHLIYNVPQNIFSDSSSVIWTQDRTSVPLLTFTGVKNVRESMMRNGTSDNAIYFHKGNVFYVTTETGDYSLVVTRRDGRDLLLDVRQLVSDSIKDAPRIIPEPEAEVTPDGYVGKISFAMHGGNTSNNAFYYLGGRSNTMESYNIINYGISLALPFSKSSALELILDRASWSLPQNSNTYSQFHSEIILHIYPSH